MLKEESELFVIRGKNLFESKFGYLRKKATLEIVQKRSLSFL